MFKCWSNLGLTEFEIITKYSKKTSKNVNPVHMFLVCHVLTPPTDRKGLDIIKQEMLQYGVKSHISNCELSCAKTGGLGFAT